LVVLDRSERTRALCLCCTGGNEDCSSCGFREEICVGYEKKENKGVEDDIT
jgi:hypothetical protein